MKTFPTRIIFSLLVLLFVVSGCIGYVNLGIWEGSQCSSRYEKGIKRPLFHETKILNDPEKAVIVLYQPFYRSCGRQRERRWEGSIFIDGREAISMPEDYFTVLTVEARNIKLAGVRKLWNSYSSKRKPSTSDGGKLEITLEAGKIYYLRWSDRDKYRYAKGWKALNYFQFVDAKTADKELNGVMYLAPQAFRARVFDKKTGKPL